MLPDEYTEDVSGTAPTQPAVDASPNLSVLTPISLDDQLRELERRLITWALTASRGNKSRAATLLRIKRSTLGDRIRRCGLERPASREENGTPM